MSKSYKLCIASGSEDFVLAYLPNFDPVWHLDHLSHVYLFGATLVMYPGDPCLEREVANLLFLPVGSWGTYKIRLTTAAYGILLFVVSCFLV